MTVLKLRSIRKHFGQTIALDKVDLSLERGEVHALIGENGAGKSTLLNVISGSVRPDLGSIDLNGKPYSPSGPLDARRNGIALIHQELSLAPHLSVAENVLMGMEKSRWGWLDRKELHQRTRSVLGNFGHLDIRPNKPVRELPVASQQVVEICRAIAANANIVLMDEPTSSLHRNDVRNLFKLIRSLRGDGVSIIYISHFLEEVREIADSFTVLRDGRSVATGRIADVTDEYLVSQMVGRSVDHLYPERIPPPAESEILMEVHDLSAPPAVKLASFELKRGDILGIAGLVGAGRSEMVRAIFGLDPALAGTITFRGRSFIASGGKPAVRLLQGLGYLSEDRKTEGLALSLSIADNMTMTRFSACSRLGWLRLAEQERTTKSLADRLGVRARNVSQAVGTLSGGNQQKVALGRLLYQDADVLLLDEPTRGIDIGSRAKVYEIITELAENGKAILLVSSYLPELFGMCNRLAVMSRGRLTASRPIEEWTPETVMQAAIGEGDGNVRADGH